MGGGWGGVVKCGQEGEGRGLDCDESGTFMY